VTRNTTPDGSRELLCEFAKYNTAIMIRPLVDSQRLTSHVRLRNSGESSMFVAYCRISNRGRIASPRMLLDKFSPLTGRATPNRIGVADGGKDQHGRAARGGMCGD
jgi:hypothetical protein